MRVLFTCGGTAGHINPAVALAGMFQKRNNAQILFVGADGGMELSLIHIYAPPQRQTRPEPKAVPQTTPRVKPRVHERSRVRVQVREQQPVAPFAVLGFLAAAAIAIVLLLGYVQLNGVYAQTVKLQDQLVELQDQGANLEARYEAVSYTHLDVYKRQGQCRQSESKQGRL